MDTFEQSVASVEAMYDDNIRCVIDNGCKHQVWRFSMFSGGRYSCALSKKWPQENCRIKCDTDTRPLYEKK